MPSWLFWDLATWRTSINLPLFFMSKRSAKPRSLLPQVWMSASISKSAVLNVDQLFSSKKNALGSKKWMEIDRAKGPPVIYFSSTAHKETKRAFAPFPPVLLFEWWSQRPNLLRWALARSRGPQPEIRPHNYAVCPVSLAFCSLKW